MSRILCSWIGGTDWEVFDGKPKKDELGPIRRTLADSDWNNVDEIHLLNNYKDRKASDFKKYLSKKTKAKIVCKDVKIPPTHFKKINDAANALVRGLPQDADLVYLVSPGTYVMASVFILMAHNQFPATLIEASIEAGVQKLDVPFEISVQELIDRADHARSQISQGRRIYRPEFEVIQHDCAPMRAAIEQASRHAARNITLLIEGEAGTGRRLLAECIHRKSGRKHFESINCSAYSSEQLESLLFGTLNEDSKRGDTSRTRGLFRKYRDATLYFEEIDTLPSHLQTRFLQELSHLGSEGRTRPRLIFSSTRPLAKTVSEDSFRRDLFYRITEDLIRLPALRDRGIKDLKLIADALLQRLKKELRDESTDIEAKELNRSGRRALEVLPFEGNIRELEGILVRALIHSHGTDIGRQEIESAAGAYFSRSNPDAILNRALDDDFVLDDVLDEVTRHYLARAKTSTPSLRQAAKALGFEHYQTLANRIKKLEGFDW